MASPPFTPDPQYPRREFLKQVAAASTLAALRTSGSAAEPTPAPARAATPTVAPRFVGIQMGPHSLLDEGIEHTLDLIKDTAGVNAVFTYSHAYNGDVLKPNQANDHGVPLRDNRNRNLPLI